MCGIDALGIAAMLGQDTEISSIDVTTGQATLDSTGHPIVLGYFQPTFLYESIWDLSLALTLIWIARRWTLGAGQLFAIYVIGYTGGRGWIEALRTDHANHILGLRLNDWTSLLVFAIGAAIFIRRRHAHPDSPYHRRVEEQIGGGT